MPRRSTTPKAPRPAELTQAVTSAAPPPPVDPALLAPLNTDWVDTVELDEDNEPAGGPDETPAETPDEAPSPYTVRAVTDEDVDDLWDWVRQDDDRGHAFLGFVPQTSRQLRRYIEPLLERMPSGQTAFYAVTNGEDTLGFVLLNPIDLIANRAIVHLYLAPRVRGQATTIFPPSCAYATSNIRIWP